MSNNPNNDEAGFPSVFSTIVFSFFILLHGTFTTCSICKVKPRLDSLWHLSESSLVELCEDKMCCSNEVVFFSTLFSHFYNTIRSTIDLFPNVFNYCFLGDALLTHLAAYCLWFLVLRGDNLVLFLTLVCCLLLPAEISDYLDLAWLRDSYWICVFDCLVCCVFFGEQP